MRNFFISIITSNIANIVATFTFIGNISISISVGLIIILILLSVFCFLYFKTQIINEWSSSMRFRIILFGILYSFLLVAILLILKMNYNYDEKIIICLLYIIISISVLIIFVLTKKTSENDIGIVASCLPIEIDDDDKSKIKIYLIRNPNHEKRWMFPGGHVKSLKIDILNIVKEKTQKEAGLEIDILKPPERSNDTAEWRVISGLHHFTYSLSVAEDVKCNRENGHKFHIDSVFIGNVKEIHDPNPDYRRICIELNLNDVNENKIRTKIINAIDIDNKKEQKGTDINLSKDIPKRIEIALKSYIL